MKTVNSVYVAAVKCVFVEQKEKMVKNLLMNLNTQRVFEVIDESLLDTGQPNSCFDHEAPFFIFGNEDIRIKDMTLNAYSRIGSPTSNFDLDSANPEELFNCPFPAPLKCFEIFELFFENREDDEWFDKIRSNVDYWWITCSIIRAIRDSSNFLAILS